MRAGTRWCLLLGACSVAVMGMGCASRRVQAGVGESPALPEVEYMTVRTIPSPTVIELPGAVVAVRAATLTAPVAGQVRALAEEGAELRGGQSAALLDAAGLPEQVRAAQAALDAAERRRASAHTAVRQAVKEVDTTVATLQQTVKAVDAERDRRRAALAEARVQAAIDPARLRAQLGAAEARVRQLRSGEREQRIRQMQAELEFLRAELAVAQSEQQRREELYGKGYVSAHDLELARLGVQRSRAKEVQQLEELHLAREGAHPEAIREAEQQVEAAKQAVRAAAGLPEQVAQRRAELAAAEADVVKARQNLGATRSNRLAILRAQQDAEASDAEARRWQADLTAAHSHLAQATVRAPFAGQVVRRRARPGETVMAGAPLLELVDPHRLQFEASVSQADVSRVAPGDRLQVRVPFPPAASPARGAELSLPSLSRRPRAGRVAEVILASEPTGQAYRVKVELESTAGLRPGMVGAAQLTLRPSEAHPRLPLTCLRRHFPRQNRAEILVLEGDHAVLRTVRLGASVGRFVTVDSGLKEGERVVISAAGGLPPTGPVRAREVTAS